MLVFTDRHFNTIVLAGTKDLPILEDSFNDSLETGTAMLKVTLPKTNQDISKITVGSFVFAKGYRKEIVCLEVMEVFEARLEKEIVAEDVGLELLNEEAGNIDMKGTLREFIVATLGSDSSWEIGLNEIDNKTTRTLAYEGSATITKRINMIAGRFGAEVSYSFEEKGGVITRKLINFHKERGRVTGRRLEIGKELEDVQRHISITDLCTAVRPYGEPYEKAVKIAIPYNLLRSSNRESSTRNYKVGEWQLATNVKEGEMVTITFKGVISPLQKFRVYNSGSNHSIGFLEKISDGIYSARLKWTSGQEGNTSLWAYQYPDRGSNNDICKVEWAVMTKEDEVASKWLPSVADETGNEIPSQTNANTTPTQTINVPDGDQRIETMVQWFKSREGRVGYSQTARLGPGSYDCSSSVLIAAKHANLIPSTVPTSNTGYIWDKGGSGTHFHQISASQARRGDIFVSRSASSSSRGTGHTGLYLDDGKTIIHCTVGAGKRGIMTTPAKGWLGNGGIRYLRFNVLRDTPSVPTTTPTKPVAQGKYWTNDNIIYHDLGKSIEGLTAAQLNNWIKAKRPSSPFAGKGNVFVEAQKQSGLDARYLVAHAAHESAWGTSNIASRTHNYFGIGAVDSDPLNGAKRYSNADLTSGIIGGAKWISDKYYNSTYKQTTLYKMRWNNGVHQYATDPLWHTKIANIMKGSEPFTKASTLGGSGDKTTNPGALKPVGEIKYEDKTIEVELNLIGYKYDDGRYYVNEKGEICDKEALEKWGRFAKYSGAKSKHILRPYESKATTQKTLLDEGLRFLQQNNEPKVEYEIDLSHVPEGIELGDTVRIIDHDFKPALYLDARLVDLTLSLTDRLQNKAVFSNFEEKEGGINDQILKLQDLAKSLAWKLDSQPYEMNLTSSLGNIFKDGIIQTDLRANIIRAGIDQSATMDSFIWERVSKYEDKIEITDGEWNEKHLTNTSNVLTVTNTDVDLEATFTCSAVVDGVVVASAAYTIKDLTIGIFTQEEEPDRTLLSWGDIWKWDDGTAPFKRVWKGDRWEDTVTNRDLELIELTPGPPGADGKDGMPGEPGADGKTSYTHFAYADSSDGVVGFTTTTTPGKKYIGMYVDFTKADSDNPSDYAWSQFKGEDGQDGTDGIPGKAGVDGKTPYFHQAWANSADGVTDFSTTVSADKIYIGTYVDFTKEDSEDPDKYKWIKVRGNDGEQGPPGTDGKTGSLGRNLLKNSNILIGGNSTGRLGYWELDGDLKNNEEVTVTLNADLPSDRWVKLFDYNESTELATLTKNENGLYSATFFWKTINTDKVSIYIGNMDDGVEYDFNWITLQRGDIPALDWSSSVEEIKESIDEKIGDTVKDIEAKQESLVVHLQQTNDNVGKSASEIQQITLQREKEKRYLEALMDAVDSDDVNTLRDRLAIIEANVGAGKVSINAITSYLEFAEEGLLIGKSGEQVKLRVVNDALEIIDGTKVVARFANNQAETPNLRVPGVFEFGYHMATREWDPWGNKVTVIRPIEGGIL